MTGALLAAGVSGTASAAEPGDSDGTQQQADGSGRHGVRRAALKTAVEATAGAIGVSVDELKAGVPDGSTIADYAASKGVPLDEVTSAIVSALSDKLDQAAADGKISAERAAKVEERLPELTEKFVRHERGSRTRGAAADA
jgi:ribosomal protein S20